MIEIIKLQDKRKNVRQQTYGIFVRLDRQDALELIISLAEQIKTDNPNSNRKEWLTIKNKMGWNYFTISVNEATPFEGG